MPSPSGSPLLIWTDPSFAVRRASDEARGRFGAPGGPVAAYLQLAAGLDLAAVAREVERTGLWQGEPAGACPVEWTVARGPGGDGYVFAGSAGRGPLEGGEGAIGFEDLFDLALIQQIQDAFAEATGVGALITRPDGTPITRPSRFCRLCQEVIRGTEQGLANCQASDACIGRFNPEGPVVAPCLSGGLWDGGASIQVGGRHVANWLIGQVLDPAQDEAAVLGYVRSIGGDVEEAQRALPEVTRMSQAQFERVARLLFLVAGQLSRLAAQNREQAREIAARRRAEADKEKLQAQLLQAQKMEALGRLAGGVAHDFNNILTGISGYTELLLDSGSPTDPRRDGLEQIRHGVERATELTRQLLGFSRRQVVVPAVVDLNEVTERSRKLLTRIIGEDVELRFEPGAGLCRVRIDPGQLEQVLVNLAVNARDAMTRGGRLTVATGGAALDEASRRRHPGARPGPYSFLEVRDTGSGIDPETLAHLFEPFFTTKPAGHGTGLGLATVYGIAEQNGGFVSVESEVGRGSTFRVWLPCAEAGAPRAAPAGGPAPVERAGPGGERILVIEDDRGVRTVTRRALERHGYRIVEAATPAAARELVEAGAEPIDLVVTDVVMPGQNGRDLYLELARRRPGLKVLFMSGYTENVLGHHGVLDPEIPFLAKPFTVDALLRAVRASLERREPLRLRALGVRETPPPFKP